jgi:hypothetical protein
MKVKIRLAIAAAVAIFAVALTCLPKPAEALCRKTQCYQVSVDYDGYGPAECCNYSCASGDTWACVPNGG